MSRKAEMECTLNEAHKQFPLIPMSTLSAVYEYTEKRRKPGDFVYFVLCNDLVNAVGQDNYRNHSGLLDLVCLLHNYAPGNIWGSKEIVDKWLAGGCASEGAHSDKSLEASAEVPPDRPESASSAASCSSADAKTLESNQG